MSNSRLGLFFAVWVVVSGCAGDNLPPPHPAPPKMARNYAPPPMPPMVMARSGSQASAPPKDGIVRLGAKQRVGSSYHVEAGEDRTYRVNVGMGTATSGPQQVSVELPEGYQLRQAIWPNKELLDVTSARVGSARSGRYVLFFRPKNDTGGARIENVSIATDKAIFKIDVHVVPGRTNNLTLKLTAPEGQDVGENISAEALCLDNNFSWDRSQWWAPIQVCAAATPTGSYSMELQFAPNIQGGAFPVAMGWRDLGNGKGSAMALNYRVNGNSMSIDNIPNIVQLTGDGAPIYIYRGEQ